MLILIALFVTALAEQPLTVNELISQPIPKEAEQLSGQALVDYVNKHQTLWKAKHSPGSETYFKSRIMNSKYLELPNEEKRMYTGLDVEPPESFDARKQWPNCPSISYIRDQSACGSCWAVSSAAAMSDRACIQSNGTFKAHLSDTDIIACCEHCGLGCEGGMTIEAWRYLRYQGVCTGGRYKEKNTCKPYAFYPCGDHIDQKYYGECPEGLWPTPKCRRVCHRKYAKSYKEDKIYGKSAYAIARNEKEIRKEIMMNGPVVASFRVYTDFFNYNGGIYVHTAGKDSGGHAVKIIGWGKENGTDYWLIANSWNTDWGEDGGYFRILRGSNHCEIEHNVVAGMIKVKKT